MASTGDDLLKEAIANTEIEIFSEATGKDLPSTEGGPGDRSAEEMGTGHEGQLEADDTGTGDDDGATDAGDGEGDQGEGEGEGDGRVRDPETGQFRAKTDAEKAEDAKAAKAAEVVDKPVDPKARVPLSELMTERNAKKALEKQLNDERTARAADQAKSQSEFERLNQRLDQLLASPQQKPAAAVEPQKAAGEPDIFEDPEGFIARLESRIVGAVTTKFDTQRLESDLARTHAEKGEAFEKAYTALTSLDKNDPAARAQVQKIWKSPTPGADLIKWYNQQETLRAVGDDPAAYEARIRTETREALAKDPEFRKALVAELRGEKPPATTQVPQNGAAPKQVFRMPKSLNGAAGGANQGGQTQVDGSERGVFDAAFADSLSP